jgi:hypothetical protein
VCDFFFDADDAAWTAGLTALRKVFIPLTMKPKFSEA